MPSNFGKIITPIAIITVASLIAFGFYLNRPEPQQAEIIQRSLVVNATRAVKENIRISVQAQGMITPRTKTTLIAEVSGRVIEVANTFKAGGYFNKGDLLLRIDQRDYLANIKRAEAAVATAQSNLASEIGQADVAYKDWVKYKSAVQRSQAANDLALRKPQLEDAKAKLASAMADLETARDQLDRTLIRAPYDGLIQNKNVDIGQYVNTGTQLATTFAIDYAELRLPIPESKLNYLELPTLADGELNVQPTVELVAEIGGYQHQWQGKIVRTEGVFDERSRVLFAVAEIDDPYGVKSTQAEELRVGTFVNAQIEGRMISNLIALPRHLLRAGNQIWVIDNSQQLQNRKVSILRTEGPQIYITQGLNEGELICLSNISGVIPGTKVQIGNISDSDTLFNQPSTPELPTPETEPNSLAPAAQKDSNEQKTSHAPLATAAKGQTA